MRERDSGDWDEKGGGTQERGWELVTAGVQQVDITGQDRLYHIQDQ